MRAIILAAGMGKRLFPLTKNTHKSVLKIKDKPLIEGQVEQLIKLGINEIAVVVGYKKEQIMAVLGNKVKYFINPDYSRTNSIYSLWVAKEFIKGDDVLIFNGDLLVDPAIIKDLIEKESNFCTVIELGKWNQNGYKVTTKDNWVVSMGKDIITENCSGEYSGMNKIGKSKSNDVIEMLNEFIKENKVNEWYETAFVSMIKRGHKMDYVDTNGRWWIEIDYKEELEKAREYFQTKIGQNEL